MTLTILMLALAIAAAVAVVALRRPNAPASAAPDTRAADARSVAPAPPEPEPEVVDRAVEEGAEAAPETGPEVADADPEADTEADTDTEAEPDTDTDAADAPSPQGAFAFDGDPALEGGVRAIVLVSDDADLTGHPEEKTDPFRANPSLPPDDGAAFLATSPGSPDRLASPAPPADSEDMVAARQVESLLEGLVSPFPKVRGDPQIGAWTADRVDGGLVVRLAGRQPVDMRMAWHATTLSGDVPAACATLELGAERRPVVVLLGPGLASHRRLVAQVLDDGATTIEQVWRDASGTWWTVAEERLPLDARSRDDLTRILDEVPTEVIGAPTHHLAIHQFRREGSPSTISLLEPWLAGLDAGRVEAFRALLACNVPDLARRAATCLHRLEPDQLPALSSEIAARAEWVARPLVERFVGGVRPVELVRIVQEVLDLVRTPALAGLILEDTEAACAVGGRTLATCIDETHLRALESTLLGSTRSQVRVHGLTPLAALAFDPVIPPPSRAKAHLRLVDLARSDRSKVVREQASAFLSGNTAELLESLGRTSGQSRARRDAC